MTKKTILATGALFLASFSMAFANSYEVAFAYPVQAGTLELPAGSYRISHRGDQAIFTDLNTGKVFKTYADVEEMAAKNPEINVTYNAAGNRIETISLGGHAVDLQFNR